MKHLNFIVVILLLSSITLFSQSEINNAFKFNNDASTDFVTYSLDTLNASIIYSKTVNWINVTYKNPEKVIKAKIENEMIRIDGFSSSMFSRTFQSGNKAEYDVAYTIEIQIRDGKYRLKYIHNKITIDGSDVYFTVSDVINNITDKNGNSWAGAKTEYEDNVNEIIKSLYEYISKPKEKW